MIATHTFIFLLRLFESPGQKRINMKKFILSCGALALLAVFSTSCHKDDNGDGVVKKKLVKVDEDGYVTTYSYDNDGRCIKMANSDNGKKESYYTYEYSGNTIKEIYHSADNSSTDTTIYTLNSKGYVEKSTCKSDSHSRETVFSYDGDDHLISDIFTNGDYSDKRTYEWSGGNLIKETTTYSNDSTYKKSFKYTNSVHTSAIENKAKLLYPVNFEEPIYSKFGAPSKNVVVGYIYSDGDEENYSWTFDNDGYPTKRINIEENEITTYVWE